MQVIVLTSMGVGACVAFTGVVGFVGLLVPHAVRLVALARPSCGASGIGPARLGASLVVAADVVARTMAAPAELPLGVMMAMIGAPCFLWLLVRQV